MKELKIFDACEEIMHMDESQLLIAHKHFDWKYLRQSLEELRAILKEVKKVIVDLRAGHMTAAIEDEWADAYAADEAADALLKRLESINEKDC
jgi:hypothetical protein